MDIAPNKTGARSTSTEKQFISADAADWAAYFGHLLDEQKRSKEDGAKVRFPVKIWFVFHTQKARDSQIPTVAWIHFGWGNTSFIKLWD